MRDPVFGFSGPPFASTPDPNCWAPVAGQRQAFEALVQCIESGRGIAILTAEAGTGKSLLCQRIADRLHNNFRVAYLAGGRFDDVPALLQAVLFELGWPYQGLTTQELRLQLTTALREIRRESHGTVLILDEAHSCSEEVLEEVRAATNLCADGRPLLRVLLSGQFSLEEMLTSPRLDALNQRIGCHVSLEPLTRTESSDFITYRLQRAGAELRDVIAPPALQTICYAAAGNPRCLNRLCDRSFEIADEAGQKPLDDATVRLALEDLKRLPLHWSDPPPVETHVTNTASTPPVADAASIRTNIPSGIRTETTVGNEANAGSVGHGAGDVAVVEFGADDFPQAANENPPGKPASRSPKSPSDPARESQPVGSLDTAGGPKPQHSEQNPATLNETAATTVTAGFTANSRPDETEWTAVEPISATRREPSATAPEIRFATEPGRASVRIQPGDSPESKPQSKQPQPMQEEIVEDHYAALIAAQRRQPPRGVAASPPDVELAPQPAATAEPPSPDAAIDTLLAVVQEAVDDREADDANAPASRPRDAEREPAPFHSIEDYLQSARQDAVRMDRQEPQPGPSARQTHDPRVARPRDADLYARLRRLQDADP